MRSVFKKFLELVGKEEEKSSRDVITKGEVSHNYLVLGDTVKSDDPSSHEIHSILNRLENNKDINDEESLSIPLSNFKNNCDKQGLNKLGFPEKPNVDIDITDVSLLEVQRLEVEQFVAGRLEAHRLVDTQLEEEEFRAQRLQEEEKAEIEWKKIEADLSRAQEKEIKPNEMQLDILDSQEDIEEEYASEDTFLQPDIFEIAEDFWSCDNVVVDPVDLDEENKLLTDLGTLERDQFDTLLTSFEYEKIVFDENDVEESKFDEEPLAIENNISPEIRIKQLVQEFISEINCDKTSYEQILESIFWGIHNTHSLVAKHVVRRSKAQESAIRKLIVDYEATPQDLEMVYYLKTLWNDNEFLWSSYSLRKGSTSQSNFNQNYKILSWEVCYEFIVAFPFLSDEVLIEQFLFSLYAQWFENKVIHAQQRYKAFLFYLREMMVISQDCGERAHHLLRDYNGWFDNLEYFLDELSTDEHMDLKVLLELDYAEL